MPTSAKKVSFESKQLRISFSKANVRVTNTHAIPQSRRERDEVQGGYSTSFIRGCSASRSTPLAFDRKTIVPLKRE